MKPHNRLKRLTALFVSLFMLVTFSANAVPASAVGDIFQIGDIKYRWSESNLNPVYKDMNRAVQGLEKLRAALKNHRPEPGSPGDDLLKDLKKGKEKLEEYERGNVVTKLLEEIYKQTGKMKGAAKAFNIFSAIWSFYDMGANPKVGYEDPAMEFGANTVRGMSAASGVVLPGVGPLVMGGIEYLVTSETGVKFGNYMYRKRKEFINSLPPNSHLRAEMEGNELALQYTVKGLNWIGTKSWEIQPLWMLWYDVPNYLQEREMAKRLAEAKKRYQMIHGVPYVKGAKGATAPANNVGVYKPNIYLYPEEETGFSVIFARPELLTVSDPLYEAGWQGTAFPDGTLCVDGDAHRFLFYESLTDERYYQRDTGFLIPAENREAVFTEILTGYGLNAQEIADFNEFWCGKLNAGSDYAMYPQLTETVDTAMPVTVMPAPDSVLRIWFAFAENETPAVSAKPQAFAREGSVMVEWGGFFFSDQ